MTPPHSSHHGPHHVRGTVRPHLRQVCIDHSYVSIPRSCSEPLSETLLVKIDVDVLALYHV